MWLLLLVVMAAFVLTACQKEYAVDGEFMAYEVSVSHNAPQVTMVTVTIEKGKVADFYIDVRQGSATDTSDPADGVADVFAWNEKTKKELGDDYGMASQDGQLEWFEQAEAIEAYWLENGISLDEVDENGDTDAITGVSITVDAIYNVGLAALELAKAGEFQALAFSADDLYIASMTVEKGKFSDLVLDVLQGAPSAGTFVWNTQTKQELGFDYGMAGVGGGYSFVDGAWVSSGSTATLEWFEQAALITDYVQANGWNGDLEAIGGRGATVDGSTLLDDLAGVTIHSQTYYDVLADLFAAPADDVEPAAE